MTRYNILWGILHGGSDTTTEWVRGTSERLGFNGRDKAAKALFPDRDDSLRGWLVETFVRAALTSMKRDAILALDPVNTYKSPLSDPDRRLFTTRSNFAGANPLPVMMAVQPSDSAWYSRTVRFLPPANFTPPSEDDVYVDGTYIFTYTPSAGNPDSLSVAFDDGSATVPFDDGSVVVRGVRYDWFQGGTLDITYKARPKFDPVGALSSRLNIKDGLPDMAGDLCLELLRGYL